jgi:serine/threonine protein kinase
MDEARTASAFDHPHVCTVHDIDETPDGQVFMAMAYVPGETLKARLARGALSVAETLDIAIQVAEGLLEAHEHGIAHRDIKPGNVLIDHGGRVKIVDFGLATLVGLPQEPERGMIMGTLAYMSPEQTRNEPVDHRSDIWSLGVTIVEMLTGRPPFGDRESQPLLHRVQTERPEPLERQRPDVPTELAAVVSRCLQKDRHRRYRTAVELHRELLACRALIAERRGAEPLRMPSARPGLVSRLLRRR